MKLCFISDTHNQLEYMTSIIPKGIDYLIHCGDITNYGNIAELSRANKVFGEIKQEIGCEIICIAGNHDLGLEGSISFNRQILSNCVYVEDNSYKLMNGMWLYGSPITPRFYNWAFMKEGSSIKEYWEQIPDDTDILITHGPPKNILDKNGLDEECGCPYLRDKVLKLPNLKIHAYGHIHQAAGQTEFNNIKFINASSINPNGYRYYNKPIVIDI